MRKLGLVLASLMLMLVTGLLAYKAEATPMLPSIPQSSLVETVACGGHGPYCPARQDPGLRPSRLLVRAMRRLLPPLGSGPLAPALLS